MAAVWVTTDTLALLSHTYCRNLWHKNGKKQRSELQGYRHDSTRISVNKITTQMAINFSGLNVLVCVWKQKSVSTTSEANRVTQRRSLYQYIPLVHHPFYEELNGSNNVEHINLVNSDPDNGQYSAVPLWGKCQSFGDSEVAVLNNNKHNKKST